MKKWKHKLSRLRKTWLGVWDGIVTISISPYLLVMFLLCAEKETEDD